MISDRDVAFYREKGYLVVPDVLDRETLTTMKSVLADLVAKAKGVTKHNDVYDLEPTHTPQNVRPTLYHVLNIDPETLNDYTDLFPIRQPVRLALASATGHWQL